MGVCLSCFGWRLGGIAGAWARLRRSVSWFGGSGSTSRAWCGFCGSVCRHLTSWIMISSCPVVVTLMALVRRRTRRRLFVAGQILVVVIDTVVDEWRPRGGVVLAARVPTRLSAVLGGRHPVAIPGAGVLFVVITYIIGSLGRRIR